MTEALESNKLSFMSDSQSWVRTPKTGCQNILTRYCNGGDKKKAVGVTSHYAYLQQYNEFLSKSYRPIFRVPTVYFVS